MAASSPEAQGPDRRRFRIGHLRVDRCTLAGALDAIELLVDAGRGGVVVTPNADHVVLAERHPEFRAAYAAADLSLADGMPILWASRLLRDPLPEKVSGSDLIAPLMSRAARRGWGVFLLGGGPGVAAAAAERVNRLHGARVVGTAAPAIPAEVGTADPHGDSVVATIRQLRPELVLVAFGAPKQELWMQRRRAELAPSVLLGIGGGLDYAAGRLRRAPRWVSRAGLEWLWRLGSEPRRLWRRYLLEDPRFAAVLWRELWRRRL